LEIGKGVAPPCGVAAALSIPIICPGVIFSSRALRLLEVEGHMNLKSVKHTLTAGGEEGCALAEVWSGTGAGL